MTLTLPHSVIATERGKATEPLGLRSGELILYQRDRFATRVRA